MNSKGKLFLIASFAFIGVISVPLIFAQNNAKSEIRTNIINLTKYTDEQGRFSMSYPSRWNVQPAMNRFQTVAVGFSNRVFTNSSFASVNIAIDNATTQTDPALYVDSSLSTPEYSGFSLFQNVECAKYKVDGNKACDILLTGNPSGNLPVAVLQIASYVDKKMYTFTMAGSEHDFDNYLPTFDNMLASFRSPPG
jgi:hypothetical protein